MHDHSDSPSAKRLCMLFLGNVETDRRIKSFIHLFTAQGYHCELIYATPGVATAAEHTIEGIKATRLALKRASGPMMFYEYHRSLRKELTKMGKYDVVFSCELYSLRAAAEFKKRNESTLIYDAREIYTGLPSLVNKPFKRWIWKRIEAKGLLKTDAIIVTAPRDANDIFQIHQFLPRSFLIRNLPLQTPAPMRNTYLRDHFPTIGTSRKILVYVGGLQKDRGLEEMITAMTVLRSEAAFVIIGGGAIEESLHSLSERLGVTDSVFFHPPINSGEVLSILASADIGVSLINSRSPSYTNALPSKVFEYIHAGLPVLSTELAEVRDVFGSAEWIEYAALDTESIASSARKLIACGNVEHTLRPIAERLTFEADTHSLFAFLNS